VIVIPLALGQTRSRESKPSVAAAQMPQVANKATSGPTRVNTLRILPMPKLPQVVLYDQYDNDLNNGIVSADRTDDPSLSAEAADNFVVPGGETWQITEVDIRGAPGFPAPASFAVHFYTDASGLPGTEVYVATGLAVVGDPDFVITLTTAANLSEGTYWVSAVGTIVGFNWYWEGRSITSNGFATAWRNPLGGYGLGCTDWARLQDCIGFSWPDQMFRIVGTIGGGTPTPTPTPGQVHLTANERIVNGNDLVRLHWTGANSPKVDIRRDGVKIAVVPNTGRYTDSLTQHGIYTYQVCEKDSHNCSNEVRVLFSP